MVNNIKKTLIFLGERTKELREYENISQDKLAEKANLSISLISKLERGQATNINLSAIINIAEALKIDIIDLLGESNQEIEIKQLHYALKKMSRDDQKNAIRIFLEIIDFK